MLSPSSPILIEKKVNEQMEKFLLRSNTSQRQLVSKIDTKVVVNELVYLLKFKKPKKIVIPESRTSIILNMDSPSKFPLPELAITKKFKRTPEFVHTSPVKLNSRVGLSCRSPIEEYQSQATPTEKMLSIYQDLVKSIKSHKKKNVRMAKTQRKIKTLNNEIKAIAGDKDKINIDYEKGNKKFEKQYMKESLKELHKSKRADTLLEYQINRFSLTNRVKNKVKSLY